MKWMIRLYSWILLAYTGWRTYDFISSQLPKNDISFWLSISFLFCTEMGLLLWHELNMNHVTTRNQESISFWMTWIDFVGSLAAGVGDMILRQTLINGYDVPPFLAQFLIYGLPAIMAANVGAVIFFQSNDSEKTLEKAKRQLRFEIYETAMKELQANQRGIATAMKKEIYSEIKGDVMGTVAKEFANVQVPEYVESNSQNNKSKTKSLFTNIKSKFTKNEPAMVSNNAETQPVESKQQDNPNGNFTQPQ